MIERVLALIIKELQIVWRDPRSRYFLIFPPLLQLFVFSFAATLDVKNVPIAFLNRDSGQASFELIQRFRGSPTFKKNFSIESVSQIKEVIDTQKALMVIHIDELFSRDLKAQKKAQVQLIIDGRKSNTGQIVLGYATQIIDQFSKEFSKETLRSEIVSRNFFNPNLLYYWFNVPNLCGVLTMISTMIITSLSVARERELGTFDQMLVSPLTPFEILIGKTVPAFVISLTQASLIILVAIFFFQIPFTGSVFLLYVSLIIFVGSIVGIGLFLSCLAKTQQQSVLATFIFLSPALLLSGYATPIENMPKWLQTLNLLNPLRYFLVIVKGIFLKEMGSHLVLSNVWPMALIGVFTFFGAGLFFSKRLE
jgi:ABC-2 type transport system permease protein